MTSIQFVQMRLAEAVETQSERSADEQRSLLADLLAIAFAASRPTASLV